MIDNRVAARPVMTRIAGTAHNISREIARANRRQNGSEPFALGPASTTSSASSQNAYSAVAHESSSLRAAAKLSTHANSNTVAPNDRAISMVRSVLPVSTTTISSKIPRTDSRQRG